jgi:amino-acid N-acetyltransferase
MAKTSVENVIRQAKISDAQAIYWLVLFWADRGKMLPRPLTEIYECIRDFSVCEMDGRVVGAVALHVVWENIAEIRSLVVVESCENKGVGKMLVERALAAAGDLGVGEVFALTYIPEFFNKMGFSEIDKQKLPHKIWSDCVKCHKFPDCDETAISITLQTETG